MTWNEFAPPRDFFTYDEVVSELGEPVRTRKSGGGSYGPPITTHTFRCGCDANNVSSPDRWVIWNQSCRAKTLHRR